MRCAPITAYALCLLLAPADIRTQTVGSDSVSSFRPSADPPDLEEILRTTEIDEPQNRLLDRLLWLQEHPYDLNTVSREELQGLPGMSEAEARAVVALRLRLGRFVSIEQLDSLNEGGSGVAGKLSRYVGVIPAVRGAGGAEAPAIELRSRLQKDLQPRRGFQDGSFSGSQVKSYHRVSGSFSEDLKAGLLVEKDAGESWGNSFRSGFLDVGGLPGETRIIAGDYTIGAGQGLVIWNSASFERGVGPSGSVRRSGQGSEPNRSTDESRYLRGAVVASTLPPGVRVLGFFSSRDRAASVDENGNVTSFDESGLFRTTGEIGRRNAVGERTLGCRMEARVSPDWSVGATVCRTDLSREFRPDRTREFRGRIFSLAGVDGRLRTGDLVWFGEAAKTAGGGAAAVCGVVAAIGLRTEGALSYRSYDVDYATLRGAGLGHGQDTRNEQGVSLALASQVSRLLTLNAAFDHYRHPWHTPLRPFPSSGSETYLQADLRPGPPRSEMSLRYTFRQAESAETVGDSLSSDHRVQVTQTRQNLRITASFEPARRI